MPVTDLTQGLSLNSNPYGDPSTDAPPQASGDGLPWWLSLLGRMNPYARGAIAAGGILQPTPTAPASKDELPQRFWPQGSAPAPAPAPASPQAAPLPPLPAATTNQPNLPYGPGAAAPAVTTNQPNLPYGPAAAPPSGMPGRTYPSTDGPTALPADVPLPPVRPTDRAKVARHIATAAQSPMFVPITAPNSDPLARNRPQMSALNLSGLFGR